MPKLSTGRFAPVCKRFAPSIQQIGNGEKKTTRGG
jgi:hypothetical protein